MARWMVRSPGKEASSPVEAADLRAAWRRREIPPDTMVCAEGYSQWTPFHLVGELVEPSIPPRAPAPRMPSWLGAILFVCVFLGVGVLVLVGLVGVRIASAPAVSFNPCSR